MATANIRIDQAANPQPAGVPGRARKDLVLGQPVTLRNGDDDGVTRHLWSLLDVPIGSSAVLSAVSGPQTTFTPDVPGCYLVQLIINDGLAGERDSRIAGVVDGFGRLFPAASQDAAESNWDIGGGQQNEKGWAKETERILRSFGAPQLFNAAQAESVPVAASTIVTVGSIGLPDNSGAIVGYDFVDATGANVGSAPTVNGETFAVVAGVNGLSQVCVVNIDLDTSLTTIGDGWILIMVTDVTPLLLARLTIV